jgi:hypothetical protein
VMNIPGTHLYFTAKRDVPYCFLYLFTALLCSFFLSVACSTLCVTCRAAANNIFMNDGSFTTAMRRRYTHCHWRCSLILFWTPPFHVFARIACPRFSTSARESGCPQLSRVPGFSNVGGTSSFLPCSIHHLDVNKRG